MRPLLQVGTRIKARLCAALGVVDGGLVHESALGAKVRHAAGAIDVPFRYFGFRREALFRAYPAAKPATGAGSEAG